MLLPGILDQIELKRREYFFLFSTMSDYTAILVCNLFPISYENDFSKLIYEPANDLVGLK